MVSGVQEVTDRWLDSQTPKSHQPSMRGLITPSNTNRAHFGDDGTRRAANRTRDTPFSYFPSMSGENHSPMDRKSGERPRPTPRGLRYSAILNTHADSVQTPLGSWSPAALSMQSTFEDSPFASTSSNFSGDSAFDTSPFASSEYLSGDSAPPTATSSHFPFNSMMDTPQLANVEDPFIDDRASDADEDEPSSRSPYWKAQMQNPLTRASCIRKLREEKPRKRNTKKIPEEINVDPNAKDKVSKTKRNTQHARRSRHKKQKYIEMMQAYFEWSQSYINECETVKEEQHKTIAQLQQRNASGKPPLTNVPALAEPNFGNNWALYHHHNSDPVMTIKQEQEQDTVDLRSDTPLPQMSNSNWHQFNSGFDEVVNHEPDDQASRNDAAVQRARHRQQIHRDMRLFHVEHEDRNLHLLNDPAALAPWTDLQDRVSEWRRTSDAAHSEHTDPQQDLERLAREDQTLNDIKGSPWSQHHAHPDYTVPSYNLSIIADYENNIAFPEYDGSTITMSQSAPRMDPTKPPSYHPSLAGGSTAPMPEIFSHHEEDLPYQSIEGGDVLLAPEDLLEWRERSLSSVMRSLENPPALAQCSDSMVQQQEQHLLEGFELPVLHTPLAEERDYAGDGEHTLQL